MSAAGRALALAALAGALAACAPIHHTIEPYRSDPAMARELEAHAMDVCEDGVSHPRTAPSETFVTDGCSLWIDDGWAKPCCVDHDVLYWCGGKWMERWDADLELRRCVDEVAPSALAWLMWAGVRVGGSPIFPTYYRWGYGRDYLPLYGDYPAAAECTQDGAPASEPAQPESPPPDAPASPPSP